MDIVLNKTVFKISERHLYRGLITLRLCTNFTSLSNESYNSSILKRYGGLNDCQVPAPHRSINIGYTMAFCNECLGHCYLMLVSQTRQIGQSLNIVLSMWTREWERAVSATVGKLQQWTSVSISPIVVRLSQPRLRRRIGLDSNLSAKVCLRYLSARGQDMRISNGRPAGGGKHSTFD